jgi:hypothetical protein
VLALRCRRSPASCRSPIVEPVQAKVIVLSQDVCGPRICDVLDLVIVENVNDTSASPRPCEDLF